MSTGGNSINIVKIAKASDNIGMELLWMPTPEEIHQVYYQGEEAIYALVVRLIGEFNQVLTTI